ncbi:putative addiction module component (TIGR02574 family) [Prosthecobacter fusiformis]|uniref:Putative addiction module component (TIGR02574 family) n=1 Tax=Prosthecobacter fusiformis TaxID=48464 RepID=A0A4R7RM16_9BACT|nr:addiction module protein [Prosthecobacter fusiformis]TDU63204.1 putative addiction module component (TIGR02574 family) [Prosthecobacter fusiformis]
MTAAAESLMGTLLTLPEEDRLEIAERLQDSFSGVPADEVLTDDMKATLDRRWDEIVSGRVQCEDAFAVLDRIERRHRERIQSAS